jgi:hypothetical protein
MPSFSPRELVSRFRNSSPQGKIVALLWCLVLLVVFIRAGYSPGKNTVIGTYLRAARHWLDGADLYHQRTGFVYGPLIAALFVPLEIVPKIVSEIASRLLYVSVFLGAVALWLKAGFHRAIPESRHWLVFLLLLPLTIGNINNAQINPLLIGLIMIAILSVHSERWMLAAFCIALTVHLKIYPIAVGMLLMVVAPRKFTWRLVAALVALGALSFVLQKPSYVLEQYQLWIATRAADNRRLWSGNQTPHDLWLLLRVAHLSISPNAYMAVQVLSGAAVGAVCLLGRLRHWSPERLFVTMLSLVCAWMMLCGPATESCTYVILAPAVTLALVSALSRPMPVAMRSLIVASFALLVIAQGVESFLGLRDTISVKALHPLGTLLFVIYSGLLAGRRSWWEGDAKESPLTPLASPKLS